MPRIFLDVDVARAPAAILDLEVTLGMEDTSEYNKVDGAGIFNSLELPCQAWSAYFWTPYM